MTASGMAISAEQYIAEVRSALPQAHALLDQLRKDHDDLEQVWQVNNDLTFLLLWSWRAGDQHTCARILRVMEKGLVGPEKDGDYAPVWNSIGIGVIETVHRDLAPDDFAAFVETWPPEMRAQGLNQEPFHDEDWDEDFPESFELPLGRRVRWALRHPIRTRLGTRFTFAG